MQPKSMAKCPSKFGKPDVTWRSDVESRNCMAAQIQHDYVVELRRILKARHLSARAWCESTGQNYQRISRYMSGSAFVTVPDIAQAVTSLGISVRFLSDYTPYEHADESSEGLAAHTDARDAMGAFYTPKSVAEFMAAHIVLNPTNARVLEPSFGDGSFLAALAAIGVRDITGAELDLAAANLALGNNSLDTTHLWRGDFFDMPVPKCPFTAVIGNPPYVRIRTLTEDSRSSLKRACAPTGVPTPEEASTWMAFVLRSTLMLARGGSLAFVLPHDFTYVRYARPLWAYLANTFSSLTVVRIHDRVFTDIMQDVVLFYAEGKGGSCEDVRLVCHETLSDMLEARASIDSKVPVTTVIRGERSFLEAMVPHDTLALLNDPRVVRASSEATFHIGYVCGNKNFFHPDKETIQQFNLPKASLRATATTSRLLGCSPVDNANESPTGWLWLPSKSPTDDELRYIAHGEDMRVHTSYKCRVRKPWYIVPGVTVPDVIMSVFSDTPRIVINSAGWTYSNSLLGGFLNDDIDAYEFALSWYTPLTLLSMEIEVHALGGGVMVAVPREVARIAKLKTGSDINKKRLADIGKCLADNDVDNAYHTGDTIVDELLGNGASSKIWNGIELLRSWRHR